MSSKYRSKLIEKEKKKKRTQSNEIFSTDDKVSLFLRKFRLQQTLS